MRRDKADSSADFTISRLFLSDLGMALKDFTPVLVLGALVTKALLFESAWGQLTSGSHASNMYGWQTEMEASGLVL